MRTKLGIAVTGAAVLVGLAAVPVRADLMSKVLDMVSKHIERATQKSGQAKTSQPKASPPKAAQSRASQPRASQPKASHRPIYVWSDGKQKKAGKLGKVSFRGDKQVRRQMKQMQKQYGR